MFSNSLSPWLLYHSNMHQAQSSEKQDSFCVTVSTCISNPIHVHSDSMKNHQTPVNTGNIVDRWHLHIDAKINKFQSTMLTMSDHNDVKAIKNCKELRKQSGQ